MDVRVLTWIIFLQTLKATADIMRSGLGSLLKIFFLFFFLSSLVLTDPDLK